MQTIFLLMARHEGKAIIPVAEVCRDYFQHLSPDKFLRKAQAGEINLPVVRIGDGKKATKGVHLAALAEYLDNQQKMAERELAQMTR